MTSLAFPNMFTSTSTKTVQGHEATYQNLRLLLLSDSTTLLGDPYYGTPLRKVIFSQNDYIVRDVVVDAIYTAIVTFMPQLYIDRANIQVYSDKNYLYADISATNLLDYTTDLYHIKLTDSEKY